MKSRSWLPRVVWVGALALAASAALAAQAQDQEGAHIAIDLPGAPGDGFIIERNAMAPMRDGVRLATDIYRPAGDAKYPVVLTRTPYGKGTPFVLMIAKYYVQQGYAFAIQDCRGRYDSEGDWYGKRNEAEDGSDAITWLGTRPWSSGKVGMVGGSYAGSVQYLVADQQNPYLKALVPAVAPLTLGRDPADFDHIAIYGGRESFNGSIGWMVMMDGRVNQFMNGGQGDVADPSFLKAQNYLPRIDMPKVLGRKMEWLPFLLNQRYGFWEEYFERAARGEWSKPIDMEAWFKNHQERYRRVSVPMLHISGWYDCCGEPQTRMFQMIRQYAADPLARSNQQMILGPWEHNVGPSKVGSLDFGPEARMSREEAAVHWFDHWLKGKDNGVEKRAAVRYFVQGENRWREASDWPLPQTQLTRFYLHSKGDARLARGGGALSTQPPGREPADHYTYDPGNPTPEITKANGEWEPGPVDRAPVENRDDVLVYSSEVLQQPLEVTGPLSATIYLSTSAPSTDLFVRLIDVHPDGVAYPVFRPWSDPYRTHWSKDVTQAKDGTRIIKAEVALYMTSVLFQPGHRIRVEIYSSAAPTFRGINVEPGAEPYATRWNVAQQTIYHDRAHPSHILLPVIPR